MELTIEEQMAAALATDAGESVEAVTEQVKADATDKQSALKAMMATAKEAAEVKKVERKQTNAAKGQKREKKAKVDKSARDVIVLRSASLKLAYTLTNGFYTAMDSDKTITACRKYIGNRKGITPLLEAKDLECYRTHNLVGKDEAETLKAYTHDDLLADGYTVISARPKQVAPKVVDLPAAEEVAAEELLGMPTAEA